MVKHPDDWCAKRCGVPLDRVLIESGWNMHPGCEFPVAKARKTVEIERACDMLDSQIQSGAGATAQTVDSSRRLTDLLGDPLMSDSIARPYDGLAQVGRQ